MSEDAVRTLLRLARAGKLPHGFLFCGTRREEHRAAIAALLALDACERRGADACGDCAECRKVASGQHPDLLRVKSQKSELSVDEVHELTRWVRVPPHESPRKYAWIEDAENLNASSSNALLKTLEEPPPFAVIVLSVDRPDQAIVTIRSRLMPVRFPSADAAAALADRAPPAWLPALRETLAAARAPRIGDIFDLSDEIGKERDDLVWFIEAVQADLLMRLKNTDAAGSARLHRLYDLGLELERSAYHRYGNASLHLNRFLTEWFRA